MIFQDKVEMGNFSWMHIANNLKVNKAILDIITNFQYIIILPIKIYLSSI